MCNTEYMILNRWICCAQGEQHIFMLTISTDRILRLIRTILIVNIIRIKIISGSLCRLKLGKSNGRVGQPDQLLAVQASVNTRLYQRSYQSGKLIGID